MARNATNKTLKNAKAAKQDEFYTVLTDIEKELRHYRKHLAGKVVLCNCDDPRISNFFHYFSYNFERLGLRRLVTTCYRSQERDFFSRNDSEQAIWLEYRGDKNGNNVPDVSEIGVKPLTGDGDFRSQECIDLLKQADVVVTNPPFSLFREYVGQLVEHGKKFLVIGTWNAITYKEIFKLIQEDKLWIGINSNRNFSGFIVPPHYPLHGTEARIDEEGNRIVSSNNTCWFTNMDNAKRHEPLILYRTYNEQDYPKYDNYDAIEVSATNNIPMDYDGVMAVPITFLNKYNPEQFEILGIMDRANSSGLRTKKYEKAELTNANDLNARGVIVQNGVHKAMYARLLIRNRQL
ncbi:MAG: adenine-specific methyltransferase EcoRI family protein [Sphingomicrobium sp.]